MNKVQAGGHHKRAASLARVTTEKAAAAVARLQAEVLNASAIYQKVKG